MRIIQNASQLDAKYRDVDPWGYQSSDYDSYRKRRILRAVGRGPFARALDIGAGEGWISTDLPAQVVHGIEISDRAASRFPPNVRRVHEPDGHYDLVIATGVFYSHYDWESMHAWAIEAAIGRVVTCHIKPHEIKLPLLSDATWEFDYRNYEKQVLRVYDLLVNQR